MAGRPAYTAISAFSGVNGYHIPACRAGKALFLLLKKYIDSFFTNLLQILYGRFLENILFLIAVFFFPDSFAWIVRAYITEAVVVLLESFTFHDVALRVAVLIFLFLRSQASSAGPDRVMGMPAQAAVKATWSNHFFSKHFHLCLSFHWNRDQELFIFVYPFIGIVSKSYSSLPILSSES